MKKLPNEILELLKSDQGAVFMKAVFPDISPALRSYRLRVQINPPAQVVKFMDERETIIQKYEHYKKLKND